jgi:hypothetical protein
VTFKGGTDLTPDMIQKIMPVNMKPPKKQEFSGDNGRVLGYDNSHDYAHRHFMRTIVPDPFTSYEELYERFEREWQEIAIRFVNGEHT